MFAENLLSLRKRNSMTQEALAEKLGVSRQAVAKWESGETVPDLEKSRLIAEIFGVTLDELVNFGADDAFGLEVPPKGKHLFGIVTMGEKGQIVIPAKARKVFGINPGDSLVVLGDEGTGIALMKSNDFLKMADLIRKKK
ncbi:MAG: helix-turn-helix domain-containing protein [Clostridia bacterium]|nr:helix-turn-helix domain-containing protein [Clostridia bacterium]